VRLHALVFIRAFHPSGRKLWDSPTKSRVAKFCEIATRAGQKTELGDIKWFTFMPNSEGSIGAIVVEQGKFVFFDDIPNSLETHLRQSAAECKTIQSVSVGYNDCWIVVYGDCSSSWSDGIPNALSARLRAGYPSILEVRFLLTFVAEKKT
jgi:hypothetical protein